MTGAAQGVGYGWLGGKQRATLDVGLTLMGARLYNQTTGLFTSLDPVYRGGDTWYSYPNDPINKTDLSGEYAMAIGLVALGPLGWAVLGVAAGVALGAYAYANRDRIAEGVAGVRERLAAATKSVPRPGGRNYRAFQKFRVYQITYRERGRTQIWKYGITGSSYLRWVQGESAADEEHA